jgi:hypothetical protein
VQTSILPKTQNKKKGQNPKISECDKIKFLPKSIATNTGTVSLTERRQHQCYAVALGIQEKGWSQCITAALPQHRNLSKESEKE